MSPPTKLPSSTADEFNQYASDLSAAIGFAKTSGVSDEILARATTLQSTLANMINNGFDDVDPKIISRSSNEIFRMIQLLVPHAK